MNCLFPRNGAATLIFISTAFFICFIILASNVETRGSSVKDFYKKKAPFLLSKTSLDPSMYRWDAILQQETIKSEFSFNDDAGKLQVQFSQVYFQGQTFNYGDHVFYTFNLKAVEKDTLVPTLKACLVLPFISRDPTSHMVSPMPYLPKVIQKLQQSPKKTFPYGVRLPTFFLLNNTHDPLTVSMCLNSSLMSPSSSAQITKELFIFNRPFYYYIIDLKTEKVVFNTLMKNILPRNELCTSLPLSINIHRDLLSTVPSIPTYTTLLHDTKAVSPLGLFTTFYLWAMVPEDDIYHTKDEFKSNALHSMSLYLRNRGVLFENKFLVTNEVERKEKNPSKDQILNELMVNWEYKHISPIPFHPVTKAMKEQSIESMCSSVSNSNSVTLLSTDSKTMILNTISLGFTWTTPFQSVPTPMAFRARKGDQLRAFYSISSEFHYIETPSHFAIAVPFTSTLYEIPNLAVAVFIHPKVKEEQQDPTVTFSFSFLKEMYSQLKSTPKRWIRLSMPAFQMNKLIAWDRSDFPLLSMKISLLAQYYHEEDLEKLSIHQKVKACVHEYGAGASTLISRHHHDDPDFSHTSSKPNTMGKMNHDLDSPFYFAIVDDIYGMPLFYYEVKHVLEDSSICSKY